MAFCRIDPIVASKHYAGHYEGNRTTGRLFIFTNTALEPLTHPVFAMWGFDPKAHQHDAHYVELMLAGKEEDVIKTVREPWLASETGGILQALLARGHQVCVLLPSDGCTYLQNSAFLMLSALDYMVYYAPRGVRIPVIGFSAGGIIARWALLHLQYHSQDYKIPAGTVNAYVSFDTPHRGANVPLSLQCFVNMLAGGISFVSQMLTLGWLDASKSVSQIVAMRSPAARQLALYHLGETAPNGKHVPRCDPLRTELLSQMGEGWADGIPKHAYANGPGNGIPFERAMPRETILGFAGSDGLAFHAMPRHGEGGDVFTIGPSWARGFWHWVEPGGQPLDSAPGSRTSFFQSGVDFLDFLYLQSVLPDFLTKFLGDLKIVPAPSCFVPTTSALNQTDDVWYGAPQSPTSPPVPFDSYACAPNGTHERHVQVTDAATRYVLGCIPPP